MYVISILNRPRSGQGRLFCALNLVPNCLAVVLRACTDAPNSQFRWSTANSVPEHTWLLSPQNRPVISVRVSKQAFYTFHVELLPLHGGSAVLLTDIKSSNQASIRVRTNSMVRIHLVSPKAAKYKTKTHFCFREQEMDSLRKIALLR